MAKQNGKASPAKNRIEEREDQEFDKDRLQDDDERMVLSAILLSGSAYDDVRAVIEQADFRADAHRILFAAVEALRGGSLPINAVSVAEYLEATGDLEQVTIAYLHELLGFEAHATHATYHAERVREKSIRRSISAFCLQAPRASEDLSRTSTEILGGLEQEIHGLIERTAGNGQDLSIGKILIDAYARIGAAKVEGIKAGYDKLDDWTCGMQPGTVTILAARPSVGKTALAANIARNTAMLGNPVLFFSLEQTRLQLADRFIATESRLDSHALRDGGLTTEEREMVLEAANRLFHLPILIDDRPGLKVSDISAISRLAVRRQGVKLIVIDYVQLLEPEDYRVNREQQVATISRRLKTLAKWLNVPILLLAQLNRKAEENERPRISHLRESGSLEQDATVVLLLHRDPEKSDSVLIVGKNREGRTGDIRLEYHRHCVEFVQLDELAAASEFADQAEGYESREKY